MRPHESAPDWRGKMMERLCRSPFTKPASASTAKWADMVFCELCEKGGGGQAKLPRLQGSAGGVDHPHGSAPLTDKSQNCLQIQQNNEPKTIPFWHSVRSRHHI
jgi:hypothetical protein